MAGDPKPQRQFYSTVDLGGRALVVRSRIGGGFTKVADCRWLASAQRLVDELNGVQSVHISVLHEAIHLLGQSTNKSIAQATQLLRDAAGPEEEPCT